MTTRPGLGGSQRQPPQRSLSANIIQRPPPNRTLSQQFPPSSPARRNNEGAGELSFDGSDVLGRYGNTVPRNGGSRLKLEISKDTKNQTLVESPRPVADLTPTWKPALPPRGRPVLHFDVPSVSNLSPRPAQDGGSNESQIKPMPLPTRPRQHDPPVPEKSRVAPIHVVRKDVRPKPYVLEVPSIAPRYHPDGRADFYPWTGGHQEDQFSETAIRQGFYDKSQMTQNETGSAKAAIFPALKNKQGLQNLSALFTSVLAQRRSRGQITSASTFKPPPRVTVTDTKREIWLKDLANPTISLRRLSRSIPHGVRGKVLLDQSLSKNIPIERAVWLAKCVGANELRAFRRKGGTGTFAMGGEAKWIRDFTVCVEQFVESIVGSCGEKDFRARLNYAVRLAAHFYAEHLLDREHYMDWLVSSLENSIQAKLPMWILVTQIYWKDILLYRKFGRRVSAALLTHMAEISGHPDIDILAPLCDRVKALLKELMKSNPESFIIPKVWIKYREAIYSSLVSEDSRIEAVFFSIDERNSRLAAAGCEKVPSPRQQLIKLLDTTLSSPMTGELCKKCWQLDPDKPVLIQTLIGWSTSSYRPGNAKTYIAARMLRQWAKSGANITDAVLEFLDSKASERGRNKAAVYHLISELARSEHFSTPMYLQWIIARGGLYDAANISIDGPCATRLLAELPTHNLNESVIFLRNALLSRVEFSVNDEDGQTRSHIAFLSALLPGMQVSVDTEMDSAENTKEQITEFSPRLSRTTKSELGLWIRQKVRLQMLQPMIPALDDWDDSPSKGGSSAISPSDFNTVRKYLELLDDYSMLADVLKTVTTSNDSDVLASCADTLNLHSDTFWAIGALPTLFETLMTRLQSMAEDTAFPRVLLVSLSDLAAKLPEQSVVAQQLAFELASSDRKTAADACSPVSDHMAGVIQTAEANFTDEIEKVLASGNSMDHPTLDRLFRRIVLRLEDSWTKSIEQHRSCGLLLTRLRTFDAPQFDILMGAWVSQFLQMEIRPSMMQVFGPLISFGCLSLFDVVKINESLSISQSSGKLSHELLMLLISSSAPPEGITAEEMYRLRIKQSQVRKEHPLETLPIIRQALENAAREDQQLKLLTATGGFNLHDVCELLQEFILVHADSTTQLLINPLSRADRPGARSIATMIMDKILAAEEYVNEMPLMPIESVLGLADDLTLPFCQVKLASMFNTAEISDTMTDHIESGNLQALDKAVEAAIEVDNTSWVCIIPLLEMSIAQHLQGRAESQFLAFFPTPKTLLEEVSSVEARIRHAENLLYIIEASSRRTMNASTNTTLQTDMVAAFNNSWLLLSSPAVQSEDPRILLVGKWLPLLLSFATIHQSSFEATKLGHESRARTLLALAAILLELGALPSPPSSLIEQIFDLGLQLADGLPDDMRQQCIRGLRDTASNARISYMFSIAANPSEWLVVGTERSASGPAGEVKDRPVPYPLRRWEMLGEPTPNIGENDTSLSLTLFGARRG